MASIAAWGLRPWRYVAVVARDECPSSLWMCGSGMADPSASRSETNSTAKVCLNICG